MRQTEEGKGCWDGNYCLQGISGLDLSGVVYVLQAKLQVCEGLRGEESTEGGLF